MVKLKKTLPEHVTDLTASPQKSIASTKTTNRPLPIIADDNFDVIDKELLADKFKLWGLTRKDKLIQKLAGGVTHPKSQLCIGPMFEFSDLIEANIHPSLFMPMNRALDPKIIFFKERPYILRGPWGDGNHNKITFEAILSLRQETWVIDTILQHYVYILNTEMEQKNQPNFFSLMLKRLHKSN